MRGPRQRNPQKNVPSQAQSTRTPFFASVQQDIVNAAPFQRPHEHGQAGGNTAYVISTYDARPINAADFQTQSGTNPNDTGYEPYEPLEDPPVEQPVAGPYSTASIFYVVQPGFAAVVRDWQILIIPERGEEHCITEDPTYDYPIFSSANASNFRFVLSFFINGTAQQGMSNIVSYAGAFGDVFGECYMVAQAGDIIEMRITCRAPGSRFHQAIMSMHGNLLLSRGLEASFEPATDATIPVHDHGIASRLKGGAA